MQHVHVCFKMLPLLLSSTNYIAPVINLLHNFFNRFPLEITLKDGAVEDQVKPLQLVPNFGVFVLEVDDSVLRNCQVNFVIGIYLEGV